jgi:ATP-binding cassette, subfamily B, bacterial
MATIWRDDLQPHTSPWAFFRFVSRPYLLVASAAIVVVIIGSSLTAVIAYVFKMVVNAAATFATTGTPDELTHTVLLYVVVSAASTIVWRTSGYIGMHWATGVRATARYALSSYVTKHSHAYFSERFAGSVSSKISAAANGVRDVVGKMLWSFITFFVTMVASLWVVTSASYFLGAIFLSWIFVVTPLNIYFARRKLPYSIATQKSETAVAGATVDMLANMTAVEEYASRPFELERLRGLIWERKVTGIRNWRYSETVLLVNGLLQILFIGGLLVTAVQLALQGIISPGDIALVLIVVVYVEDRLTFIGQNLNDFAESWGQISESLDDILVPHDVADVANPKRIDLGVDAIVFNDVSFNYDNVTVFDHFSLAIPKGQKVGLVGRSGSGKSTLVKLLLRHYDLGGGELLVGGAEVSQIAKESLRAHIAVVPQEPMLFHRSIRDNIAYGNHQASEEEVVKAATLAEAHEFITRLSEGYDSLVGERGIKLSGGQRQRVAIARAILKDAPILLLDEATSALDSESEVAVQKALFNLMQGRTVIAIAHRLSTLRAMDRIIVMDQGKITEDGTHEELLEKKGLYASLWSHQASGFLEE